MLALHPDLDVVIGVDTHSRRRIAEELLRHLTKRVVLARAPATVATPRFLQAFAVPEPARQRARGATHYQALRTLANRLGGILHGCLRSHTLYDEHLAWHSEPDKLSSAA